MAIGRFRAKAAEAAKWRFPWGTGVAASLVTADSYCMMSKPSGDDSVQTVSVPAAWADPIELRKQFIDQVRIARAQAVQFLRAAGAVERMHPVEGRAEPPVAHCVRILRV